MQTRAIYKQLGIGEPNHGKRQPDAELSRGGVGRGLAEQAG
jgi:hypothetical protein